LKTGHSTPLAIQEETNATIIQQKAIYLSGAVENNSSSSRGRNIPSWGNKKILPKIKKN